MRQFKIENKTFNLKNSWEDLYFKNWLDFQRLQSESELLGIDEDYVTKILLILTDATESDLMNMELDTLNELMADMKFTKTEIPKVEKKVIEISGEKWAFKKNFQKLTLGEYVSIKTYQENIKDELQSTTLMLSVLLRRVIDEVDGELILSPYSPDESQKIAKLLIDEVKMLDIYHYLSFFFAGKEQFTLKDTEAYSTIQVLKAMNQETTK
jgi:hypothetical protein